jgi:hypothetical protein
VKQGLAFAAVAAAMILGLAWGITVMRPDLARTIWSSAVIALVAQVIGFALAKPFVKENPIAGWGLAGMLRFAVVVLHAVVGTKALGVESGPALMSLVGFLFVTMLVEPLFLKS